LAVNKGLIIAVIVAIPIIILAFSNSISLDTSEQNIKDNEKEDIGALMPQPQNGDLGPADVFVEGGTDHVVNMNSTHHTTGVPVFAGVPCNAVTMIEAYGDIWNGAAGNTIEVVAKCNELRATAFTTDLGNGIHNPDTDIRPAGIGPAFCEVTLGGPPGSDFKARCTFR